MSACGMTDVRAYEAHLLATKAELQLFIDAAVVPETWFFRDPKALAEMRRIVVLALNAAARDRPVRLLSLACSTGEEPFSMAMALLDARVAPGRFRIDAVDINSRSVAHARRAVYGKNSFRGDELLFRKRYFKETGAGYLLDDTVRKLVHFEHGNVVAPGFLAHAAAYDVIFCRNLLVYFDRTTQVRVIGVVERLLRPGGTVFVGHAEAGMMFGHQFVWSKVPFAFAFRKSPSSEGAGQSAAPC